MKNKDPEWEKIRNTIRWSSQDAINQAAFKFCIENKWGRVLSGEGVDNGTGNCALCNEHHHFCKFCDGCPIYDQTGRTQCNDTPIQEWYRHHNEHHTDKKVGLVPPLKIECDECKSLVEEIIKYLKTYLKPDGE